MKIAYLILVHKNPAQLLRLVNRLNDGHVGFYIHVDKKCDISDFTPLFPRDKFSNIFFTKREKCDWGRIGTVKGALHALKVIVSASHNYDYIILLTGQDYPIKSNGYIKEFFERNKGKIFIDTFTWPIGDNGSDWRDRVDRYHFLFLGRSFIYPPLEKPYSRKRKLLNMLFRLWFPLPRLFPANLKPFGGSAWWSIPKSVANYILDFTKRHPEYLRFHEFTFIPTEMFFQTILFNTKDKNIADNLVAHDLHYMDWKYKPGTLNPKILKTKDFDSLINTDKLFARKFDIDIDSTILDMIDTELGLNNVPQKEMSSG